MPSGRCQAAPLVLAPPGEARLVAVLRHLHVDETLDSLNSRMILVSRGGIEPPTQCDAVSVGAQRLGFQLGFRQSDRNDRSA